jgi:hypothetical protein
MCSIPYAYALLVCAPLIDATSSLAHFHACHVVLAQPISTVCTVMASSKVDIATSLVTRSLRDNTNLCWHAVGWSCNTRSLPSGVSSKQDALVLAERLGLTSELLGLAGSNKKR